jgi:hypothetical protein
LLPQVRNEASVTALFADFKHFRPIIVLGYADCTSACRDPNGGSGCCFPYPYIDQFSPKCFSSDRTELGTLPLNVTLRYVAARVAPT